MSCHHIQEYDHSDACGALKHVETCRNVFYLVFEKKKKKKTCQPCDDVQPNVFRNQLWNAQQLESS